MTFADDNADSLVLDFERFLDWFPGEYDNHEQVWQEEIDEVSEPHEHLHHIFAPVSAPAIGEHIFFVQQYLDGEPANIYRQRLYRFSVDEPENAIRLDIYSFREEARYRNAHLEPQKLTSLQPEQLTNMPGCEVYWRFDETHFTGYMKDKACTYVSKRNGERIFITDNLRLTDDEIWIRDEAFDANGNRIFGNKSGIHHKNRKVRYFTGWGGVKINGPMAKIDDEDWHFIRDIRIHNEGQLIEITDAVGQPTGWSIQLAQLTYQDSQTKVVKLGLVDSSGYTVAYSWASPDANRIGINLRWAQIGLTQKAVTPAFGF